MFYFDFSDAKLNKSGITFARKIDKSPYLLLYLSMPYLSFDVSKTYYDKGILKNRINKRCLITIIF